MGTAPTTQAQLGQIAPFFGVTFREPLGDNSDQLRGFEIADADGYVLYFGRPI